MNKEMILALLPFNYAPAEYVDMSWLQSYKHSDMVVALLASNIGKPWVSKIMLTHDQLQSTPDLAFESPLKKLALLPKGALVQIIFHAGLVLNYQLFRGVIKRQERKALETCLGLEPYRYALKKGPLIVGTLPEIFPCHFTIEWGKTEEIKKHVFRSGLRLLGIIFSKEPESYKKRLLFKFPMVSQDYFYSASAEYQSTDVCRLGSALFKKLLKEFGV